MYFPIVCGSSVFVFVLLCITLCPFQFNFYLEEEEKAGCFAIFVLQMYCNYKYSVALLISTHLLAASMPLHVADA